MEIGAAEGLRGTVMRGVAREGVTETFRLREITDVKPREKIFLQPDEIDMQRKAK